MKFLGYFANQVSFDDDNNDNNNEDEFERDISK